MMQDVHTSTPSAALRKIPIPVVDQYADDFVARWDQLIDWSQRAKGEGKFFTALAREAGATRVLDAATGTGFHAIHFADAGFDVTALDICPNMIAQASRNAADRGVPFNGHVADWRKLDQEALGTFDVILCLGSSFPHLLEPAEQAAVLKTFRRLLRPGGQLILDQRNFDAIRGGTYGNPSGLYYAGTGVHVRPTLDSGVCTFEYTFPDKAVFHLTVADLSLERMQDLFLSAGFSSLQTYGDFQADFNLNDVGFLIHVAKI